MGTDISIYVEKRVNDEWVCASPKERNSCFGIVDDEPEYDLQGIEVGRNRALYKVPTGRDLTDSYDDIETVVPPRGLPVDISPEVLAVAERYGDGGFTHSWLTLRELLDFSARGYACRDGPLGEAAGLDDFIEQLRPFGTPESVRIVFWLDG